MKRDAKFAPVGVVTVLFDDASPDPPPLDFLRTDRECLEKAWQAIQPTVRFTSPEWLLLGRSIRRLRVNFTRSRSPADSALSNRTIEICRPVGRPSIR